MKNPTPLQEAVLSRVKGKLLLLQMGGRVITDALPSAPTSNLPLPV